MEKKIEGFFAGILDFLEDIWNAIVGTITAAWNAVVEAVNWLIDSVIATLKAIFQPIIETLKSIFKSVVDSLAVIMERATDELMKSNPSPKYHAKAASDLVFFAVTATTITLFTPLYLAMFGAEAYLKPFSWILAVAMTIISLLILEALSELLLVTFVPDVETDNPDQSITDAIEDVPDGKWWGSMAVFTITSYVAMLTLKFLAMFGKTQLPGGSALGGAISSGAILLLAVAAASLGKEKTSEKDRTVAVIAGISAVVLSAAGLAMVFSNVPDKAIAAFTSLNLLAIGLFALLLSLYKLDRAVEEMKK